MDRVTGIPSCKGVVLGWIVIISSRREGSGFLENLNLIERSQLRGVGSDPRTLISMLPICPCGGFPSAPHANINSSKVSALGHHAAHTMEVRSSRAATENETLPRFESTHDAHTSTQDDDSASAVVQGVLTAAAVIGIVGFVGWLMFHSSGSGSRCDTKQPQRKFKLELVGLDGKSRTISASSGDSVRALSRRVCKALKLHPSQWARLSLSMPFHPPLFHCLNRLSKTLPSTASTASGTRRCCLYIRS